MEPAADWPSCYHPQMASWSMEQAPDGVSCDPPQVAGWTMEPAADWASYDHPQVASWTMEPAASYDHLRVASWTMEPAASYDHPQVASWIMEPAADWASYDHPQLSSWTMEQAAWATPGLLVEPMSTEVFGICHQISTPTNTIRPVEDSTITAEPQASGDDSRSTGSSRRTPEEVEELVQGLEYSALQINIDAEKMRKKMHRYPVSLLGIDKWYKQPKIVAIGPYYQPSGENLNDFGYLKYAEEMKNTAAYRICKRHEGYSYLRICSDAVDAVADEHDLRSLYDKSVMDTITEGSFCNMLFLDACFLVQYMDYVVTRPLPGDANREPEKTVDSLKAYFDSNYSDIYHDIMLLENQIPWPIVEKIIMEYWRVDLKEFIARLRDCLQDVEEEDSDRRRRRRTEFQLVEKSEFEPPHLLGLLRFYIVGASKEKKRLGQLPNLYMKAVSPRKLAEAGISLKPSEEIDLTGMCIKKKGPFCANLCMPPLLLDARPSWLINMAALEICMSSEDFLQQDDEDSAVCSYLNLLTMLVHRERDVYDLRKKGLLQGGGGFTDKDALKFFKCFQDLRPGPSYARIMEEIQDYMHERWIWIKVYGFCYRNIKIIATFCSAIVALFALLEALKTIKVF